MKDRIKLAEAMGWWIKADINWISPEGHNHKEPPDPSTNANDDYAVLEWVRENWCGKDKDKWMLFNKHCQGYSVFYKIGDYAQAALKVLNDG